MASAGPCASLHPRSRQITTPAPHHSFFTGRMPFLPPNQQRRSTEGRAPRRPRTLIGSHTLSVRYSRRRAAAMTGSDRNRPWRLLTSELDMAITRIWVLLKDWGVTAGGMGEISSPSDQGVLGLSQGHLAESSRVIL